ncbi:hypothetical protein MMC07_005536 [Pseudocyphellaria aurata]|nr:hypothetical protein [Pseudocyphellaria aurata]
MMDEASYAEALDALHFEPSTRIHFYDSNQEVKVARSIALGKGSLNKPLSIEKEGFKQIISAYGFPKVFADTVQSNNGAFACFVDHEKVDDEWFPPPFLCGFIPTPPAIFDSMKLNQRLIDTLFLTAIVIHSMKSGIRNFSLVMRINIADCSATGLYLHWDLLNDAGVSGLLKRLDSHRRFLSVNPLALLGILMEEYGRTCENSRAHNDMDVVNIERQTGMTSLRIATFSPKTTTDYGLLSKAMHACNTNLIFLDNLTNFEVAFGKFIKETMIKFQTMREKQSLPPIPADVDDILIHNIDYLLNAAEMRRYQAQSLHRRSQTQVNVLYSMISQRDSKVNISVAEDSKKIAAAAKRDSLAMKTVSMLTLIFLPGTFVARQQQAIFSAGIFHFDRAATNIVSDLWWVYFLASGLLTIVTIGVWIVYMRWRSLDIRKEEEKLIEKTL